MTLTFQRLNNAQQHRSSILQHIRLCCGVAVGMGLSSAAVPVVVVNLAVTLASKLLLISEGPNCLHTSQALTEVGIDRGPGCGITPLQLYIRAAVVLLEEEVHNHERDHACINTTGSQQAGFNWNTQMSRPKRCQGSRHCNLHSAEQCQAPVRCELHFEHSISVHCPR